MCIVSNTFRISKVRIEYVLYLLLTVSSQTYCLQLELSMWSRGTDRLYVVALAALSDTSGKES